jgi:hypothetical protein
LKNRPDLLVDERVWRAVGDPAVADSFARALFVLKGAIEGGGEDAREACELISANIEAAYLQTEAHKAALKLYLLSLTGELKPEDEPVRLIGGAIKRGAARVELARKGRAKGRGRR